jgi:hypothetical protein
MMLKDPSLRYKVPAAVVLDIDRIEQGTSILPAGFTGSWEGWLLRARTRKMLLLGGATVAAAFLVAFGVKFVTSRVAEGRDRGVVEERVERLLAETAIAPEDSGEDVLDKLRKVRRVEPEATELEARNLPDLQARLRDLDQEFVRFERLRGKEAEVDREIAEGRFDRAAAILRDFIGGLSGLNPAERQAQERLADVLARSDAALAEDREEHFRTQPTSFASAATMVEGWLERVSERYADTPTQEQERRRASAANQGARSVRAKIEVAIDRFFSPEVDVRIARLDFATLREELEAKRTEAEVELGRHLDALGVYFGVVGLPALVQQPFKETLDDLSARVDRHFAVVETEANREVEARRYPDAKDRVGAFERAAREAFPLAARRARDRLGGLESEEASDLVLAEVAWQRLLEDVRAAVRRGDGAGAARLVDAARASPDHAPDGDRLARLHEEALLLEAFWDRVAKGLEARVGADKQRWLDKVPLRDGTVEHKWEIRGVDRAARTVTVVSHRGNVVRPPETRALSDLHEDLLVALAGLSETGKDAAVRGVFALSYRPDDATDFDDATDPYERIAGYRRVFDLLDRAALGAGPLARWVDERADRLAERAAALEQRAQDLLKSAREAYEKGRNGPAHNRLVELGRVPLVHTRFAKSREKEIASLLGVIRQEMINDRIALLLPDARIERLGDATAVAFDFDSADQSENFHKGLARRVGGTTATPRTPGQTENWRLRLLPARDGGVLPEGAVVPDRPLALVSPFDPARERSMSFQLWTLHSPFFLGLELEGVSVGVLSADPVRYRFPSDVPRLPDEKRPPPFDFYGKGRGVVFRSGPLANPSLWKEWEEGHEGRKFAPPERERPARRDQMGQRWFAFEPRERPYRVRFVHAPDAGSVRLEVDGLEVLAQTGAAWKPFNAASGEGVVAKPLIQILSFTTCDIDDLVLTGRISERWRADMEKAKGLTQPR